MHDVCPNIVKDIASEIKKEGIVTAFILDNGIDFELDDTWKAILKSMDLVIVQTYVMTPLAKTADIILPGLAPFEREGTLTNDQGHVQWLRPSFPAQGDARSDWQILSMIDNNGGTYNDISDILKNMGKDYQSYSEISLFKLGDQGLRLNGSSNT